MAHQLARPHVLDPHGADDPCATCEARTLGVCDAIPDADLARLSSIVVETEVAAGQGFIDEGEAANCFFIVTAGTAKLFKLLPDGRRQITGFVGPGQFLGLAVSDTYALSAEAIDHVRYCRFQRAALRAVLDDFPQMEKRLLEAASNELVAAQEQMLLLGRKKARERLASFLLAQSRQGMPRGHSRQRFSLPMTRIDIADYLGLTIETVSRTFTPLRAERLIDIVPQNGLVICDPAGLEGLAGGLPCYDAYVPARPATSSIAKLASVRSDFTRRYGNRVLQTVC
jgi:CRP/FNR family transcriptional regulator, anaerobic regulatory protein